MRSKLMTLARNAAAACRISPVLGGARMNSTGASAETAASNTATATTSKTFWDTFNENPTGVAILIAAGGALVSSVYAGVSAKFQDAKLDKLEAAQEKLAKALKDELDAKAKELDGKAEKAINDGKKVVKAQADSVKSQADSVKAQTWVPVVVSVVAVCVAIFKK